MLKTLLWGRLRVTVRDPFDLTPTLRHALDLQAAFATGTHSVTARAVDATTRWSDAWTTVTVLPR